MDYRLYYWPIPFRGNFIRYLLAHAAASYEEVPFDTVQAMRTQPVATQALPGMAVPVLHDIERDVYVNQMPAIVLYLAERLAYAPRDAHLNALALKVVLDSNDVLGELTRANGAQMWTPADWQTFRAERLPRWLAIFEEIAKRFGDEQGWMLGALSYADTAVAALFGTMARCLPGLEADINQHAPRTWAICERVQADEGVATLITAQAAAWGNNYCGGQIEASIRDMLSQKVK